MNTEAILLEAVTLSDEIFERGANDGRGIRLAALVQKLNEAMSAGHHPLSWMPATPPNSEKLPFMVKGAVDLPNFSDLDTFDAEWDIITKPRIELVYQEEEFSPVMDGQITNA